MDYLRAFLLINHCNYTEWNSYKLANSGDGLSSLIKNVSNLTVSQQKRLLKDMEKSEQLKRLFVNGDTTKRMHLAEAWKKFDKNKVPTCK
ncbi:hypothetical protein [Tenacibaculum maritimum]|uniref:hypothetical protein n=1 Tax=Tenacibaculum maritimum TaxID=107401 RepID=UPI0012E57969|nr:hypothetical protein [Tenacibaculum maritimum]CAA0194060.1 hypothetical protein USCSE301_250061 [Tenacibaculum maritimum]CAA0252477.1 hypothetical protein TMP139_840008 [Tenacibaculum maritimum]